MKCKFVIEYENGETTERELTEAELVKLSFGIIDFRGILSDLERVRLK